MNGGAGPTLVRERTVVLQENDTLHLSRPSALLADRHGGVYVSDQFYNRVVHFDTDGRATRVFGRQGAGPGELLQAGLLTLIGDSTLAVADITRRQFTLYHAGTAAYQGLLRYDGAAPTSVDWAEGTAWLGMTNPTSGHVVAVWQPGDAAMRELVPLPREYRESPLLLAIHHPAQVAVWLDTLLVGMSASNRLRLFTTDGRALDTVHVPVRLRRGVPENVVERFTADQGTPLSDLYSAASALMLLHRRADGSFLLLHADHVMQGRLLTATPYVSLLSAQRTHACVDAPLPVTAVAQPKYAVLGDTLLILEQRIEGTTDVRTTVTFYSVDARSCEWLEARAP